MRAVLAAFPKAIASAAAAALLVAGLAVAGPVVTAVADTAPADPATPTTVAADGLPTVQIDGVAWSQVIVGGTVYVAGEFSTARPAGAAPGTSTVTRSNLLAYDLATGNLITSWAPTLNGAAYAIAASLDGTRLYVGGNFTRANGATQNRFVVLNRASGAVVAGFNPNLNAAVRTITSTPSTIYFGGNFTTAAGNSRPRLAAISATTGALLSWRVSAQSAQVEAIVLSPDNSRLIVAGRFATLNNLPARGTGAVSTSTGAVLPWAANQVIYNNGYNAGITSLSTDGTFVYGTGFVLVSAGGTGNLEGTFAANPMTGAIAWIADCHGDSYGTYANPGQDQLYVAGHAYYCGNMGGFPESRPRVSHYAMAFSKQDVMTITPDWHPDYFDWGGYRAPEALDFYPDLAPGAFTGQFQAAWTVTGTGDYVVFGGEFPTVNGQPQQGLVRMATSARSTNLQGPRLSGTAFQPAATSEAAGTAQVSWPSNWDPDNETLTYRVLRDGAATPVFQTTAQSTFWTLPRLSFTDTGLVAGQPYSYVVVATDPFGNSVTSPAVTVTAAGGEAADLSTYAQEVLGDGPAAYWRLGEASGAAQDWTGFADSNVGADVVRAVPGALGTDPNGAAQFTGVPTSRVYGTRSAAGINQFSVEAWFKTTSTTGGRIVGFGNSASGQSRSFDRQVYLGADGRLTFGVSPNSMRVVTAPTAYNDGQWHHVVAELSTAGMQLYVDGALQGADPATITAGIYSGYWRIGGDVVTGWPNAGAENFTGDIDEVAVYGRALTSAEVAAHYAVGSSGTVPNAAPVASFVATGGLLTASVDGAASTDTDGTIASYAWQFGDGGTATGLAASHTYSAGGTYTVTLTVTDDDGATGTTTRSVVVTAPNQAPVAAFTATPTGLTAAVDATGSTDADGTIATYAWAFGDGATATGVTASHPYATAGTFTVSLTVTDDDGAPATVTHDVTVTAPATGIVAADAFGRTVASGWGSADLGGAWTTTAGAASVTGGTGRLTMAAANSLAGARLPGVTGTALATQVTESWDKRPGGSGGWFLLRGKITTGGEYRLKVGHKATGAVTARVVRTNAAGTETAITAEVTVPGLTYAAGTRITVLFDVSGTAPSTLRAKVWAATGAQPAAWLIETTDATAELQVTGHAGLAALASSTATNAPLAVTVDDFTVTGPH